MGALHTFTSPASFMIFEGGEHELSLEVEYSFIHGHPPSWDEPGHEDDVEIQSVRLFSADRTEVFAPRWLHGLIEADETLRDSLIAAGREGREDARASAAEARAEIAREIA